jgi:hypothetical protein
MSVPWVCTTGHMTVWTLYTYFVLMGVKHYPTTWYLRFLTAVLAEQSHTGGYTHGTDMLDRCP